MYVLIIFWIVNISSNSQSRPAIESVEFTTMDQCQNAIKAMSDGKIPGERYYLCLKH